MVPIKQNPNPSERAQNDLSQVLSLEDTYRVFLREWRIFVVTLIVFFVLATAEYLIATPLYEATLVLIPNSFQVNESNNASNSLASSLSNLAGLENNGGKVDDYSRFRLLLTSKTVGTALLADKRIARQISRPGDSTSQTSSLSYKMHDLINDIFAPPPPSSGESMAEYVKKWLIQNPSTDRLVIALSYRSSDPDFAEYFLTKVQQDTDNSLRATDSEKYRRYQAYLEKELEKTSSVQNHLVLTQILTSVTQKLMLLSTSLPYAAEILDGPRVSQTPVTPSLLKNYAVALVLSVFVAFGVVIFKALHPRIYTRFSRIFRFLRLRTHRSNNQSVSPLLP